MISELSSTADVRAYLKDQRLALDSVTAVEYSPAATLLRSFADQDRQAMFGLAYDMWVYTFAEVNPAAVIPSADRKTMTEDKNLRANLKSLRVQALLLTNAYHLFDEQHAAPIEHRRVVKRLGRLNDRLPEEHHSRFQQRLLWALDDYDAHSMSFTPVSDQGYQAGLDNLMGRIGQAIDQDWLPLKQVHALRRDVRTVAHGLHLATALDSDQPVFAAFQSAYFMNRELSRLHTGAFGESPINTKELEETPLPLPENLRIGIHELIG